MAAEPRLARRILGEIFVDKARATAPNETSARFFASKPRPEVGYVFIFDGKAAEEEYGAYRARRVKKLEAYCRVAKHIQPQLLHVLGIATEPPGTGGSSEDLLYLDAALWNEADAEQAAALYERGLMKHSQRMEMAVREFPELQQVERTDRRARNKRKAERRKRRRQRR